MSKEEPVVSVVIPTHNRAHFLERAVTSVEKQGVDDYELLIVDDRSTDTTTQIIQGLCEMNPHIRYLENAYPRGPSGARNFGIDNSSGKYIAFLDSDDTWSPGHLRRAIRVLENYSDVDLYFGNKVLLSMDSGEEIDFFETFGVLDSLRMEPIGDGVHSIVGGLAEALIAHHPMVIQATVIRKTSIKDIRFRQDISLAEDWDFLSRLYFEGGLHFAVSLNPSVYVARHSDSLSAQTDDCIRRYHLIHLKLLKEYLDSYNLDKLTRRILKKRIVEEKQGLIYRARATGKLAQSWKTLLSLPIILKPGYFVTEAAKLIYIGLFGSST